MPEGARKSQNRADMGGKRAKRRSEGGCGEYLPRPGVMT